MGNINIWVPGRPSSFMEKHVRRPMQDIDLMQYQGLIKRSAKVAFLDTKPFSTDISVEIIFKTALELDIIAASKPVLNALKGEVFLDDDSVKTLSVHVDSGPVDSVQIAIAQEWSDAGEQPHKIHSLSRIIHIPATPRIDQPPHSKLGDVVEISDRCNESAMAAIRKHIDSTIELLEGDIMLSMKIRTRDRKVDLDNIAHVYAAACQGFIFREKAQIKHLYMSFMDTEIFQGDEGVYMSFAPYG